MPFAVVSVPSDLSVRHAGRVVPLPNAHVNGGMPPLAASLTENALPTAPVRLALVVVTAGAAGTVIVTVPVCVFLATEVAVMVTVCCEPVAAGAV